MIEGSAPVASRPVLSEGLPAEKSVSFTITDAVRGESYVQPVGCLVPDEGEWRITISWAKDTPCKSRSLAHAVVLLEDRDCDEDVRCRLPPPGYTFRATMAIGMKGRARHREAQALVSVLRHEPPYLFLSIETEPGDVWARGELRVKLYKKTADEVDPESWHEPP